MPQKCAGTRILPAASVPSPSGEPPAAMIAASPPLLPPGVARRVVRIVRAAVDQVVRLERQRQLRDVGLAQHDRARGAQPRDRGGILVGTNAARPRVPPSRRCPGSKASLMVIGTPCSAPGAHRRRAASAARASAGRGRRRLNDRVQLRVDPLDAPQVGLDDLDRGQLAIRIALAKLVADAAYVGLALDDGVHGRSLRLGSRANRLF